MTKKYVYFVSFFVSIKKSKGYFPASGVVAMNNIIDHGKRIAELEEIVKSIAVDRYNKDCLVCVNNFILLREETND